MDIKLSIDPDAEPEQVFEKTLAALEAATQQVWDHGITKAQFSAFTHQLIRAVNRMEHFVPRNDTIRIRNDGMAFVTLEMDRKRATEYAEALETANGALMAEVGDCSSNGDDDGAQSKYADTVVIDKLAHMIATAEEWLGDKPIPTFGPLCQSRFIPALDHVISDTVDCMVEAENNEEDERYACLADLHRDLLDLLDIIKLGSRIISVDSAAAEAPPQDAASCGCGPSHASPASLPRTASDRCAGADGAEEASCS